MTDYHAEGVKLLAYVPARALPSAFTISPRATAPPPTTTASEIFSPCGLAQARHPVRRTVARHADSPERPPVSSARGPRKRRARRHARLTPSSRSENDATAVLRARLALPPSSPLPSRLSDQPGPGGFYEDVSPIFRLPGGGTFFIGNIRAAASLETLRANNITHIINAQDLDSENFHERKGEAGGEFTYLRFPIAHWWRAPEMQTHAGVRAFYAPLFNFAESALRRGENVMVHCLAGAHRAGTSGISLVMYFMNLSAPQAVGYVRERRPIVDPIGSFPDLLRRLEKAMREKKA